MTLLRRLLVLISTVLLASLIAGGALTYWHGVNKIDVEMDAAVSVAESAIAESLSHLPESKDPQGDLARIVAAFDGDRHVRARWIAPDDAVIKESRVGAPADPAPEWLSRVMADDRPSRSFPIAQGGASLGRIQIDPDAHNEVSEVWEDAKLKFLIIGGFCTVVLGLVTGTMGQALKPLENLSAALVKVGEGDYEIKVLEAGPEELANIYKKFNGMAGKLAESERQNRRLNEQLLTVQEEERTEIARDLHDEIGPFLFAVDVDAQTIPPLLTRGADDEVLGRAAAIRQSVGHMQTHLRSVLSRLRPAMMLDLGLSHAADQLAAFWRARRPNIEFDVDIGQESYGAAIDEIAFRVLQEGTSNAVRHGKPARISISAQESPAGTLKVSVRDDGSGLSPKGGRGFGIAGMRERVAMIGGQLTIDDAPGKSGVILTAALPLGRKTRLRAAAEEEKAEIA
ncbi:MAG: histidine kinase [Hyphomicrobium sp.]